MQHLILIIIVTLTCSGCGAKVDSTSRSDTRKKEAVSVKQISSQEWMDSILTVYLQTTDNELITLQRQKNESEHWILDGDLKTDTASYLLIHIGHHVTDEGHTNPRFATDAWVYLDSANRKLYEYDLPADQLTLWTR